jgi:hypothetical protein
MLVVVRVYIGCDGRPVLAGIVVCADVDLQDTSEADFQLNGAILIEVVIPDVLCRVTELTNVYR